MLYHFWSIGYEMRILKQVQYTVLLKPNLGEFPGGPVVRTQPFHCRGPGSIPDQRTKILQATRHGQKKMFFK